MKDGKTKYWVVDARVAYFRTGFYLFIYKAILGLDGLPPSRRKSEDEPLVANCKGRPK
jgi:hypothetical protein